ncbi:MAG: hypothetical protein E6I32_02035 [Chloroflexi bacterium]|nr:MAG: hypothetical protein E6I32_02035 [Chloroflexota bacterium]
MNKLNRRTFLTMAGASSAVAITGVAVASNELLTGSGKGKSGTLALDLGTRSGVITKTLYAGNPEAMSRIAFPGQSRIAHITGVENVGGSFRITGLIDDRSQLMPGESATFSLFIDPSAGVARTNVFGTDLMLTLER